MNTALRDEICLLHAHLCGALADSNRILILYSLQKGPRNVSELVEELQLPQPTVSRHLKVLHQSGLALRKREGHTVIYTLRDPRVIHALDLLRGVLADNLEKQSSLAKSASRQMATIN
ncbi:MAG TPA: metalloregulator ArsR/SmtB family transcription factor [Anaerolineales bacterium]|jgi:ArsR family transcriptional regulator|nr:metalloregulator ArsR/SmtB family transcription factor [Anaerolineales bacterium]